MPPRRLIAQLPEYFDSGSQHQRLHNVGAYARARVRFKAAPPDQVRGPRRIAVPLAAFEPAALTRGPSGPTKPREVHGFT